jgi:hypothetical protein
MTPAEELPDILAEICKANHGILRPADVVEAAKPTDHPLHDRFEWDDTKAGHEYRLWQARELIAVAVKVIDADPKHEATRAYVSLVSDRGTPGGGYRTVDAVLRNRKWREEWYQQALEELREFERKYRRLRRLRNVFAALHKLTG